MVRLPDDLRRHCAEAAPQKEVGGWRRFFPSARSCGTQTPGTVQANDEAVECQNNQTINVMISSRSSMWRLWRFHSSHCNVEVVQAALQRVWTSYALTIHPALPLSFFLSWLLGAGTLMSVLLASVLTPMLLEPLSATFVASMMRQYWESSSTRPPGPEARAAPRGDPQHCP